MSFMLGSFAGGLFGGAESALKIGAMYDDAQDRKAQRDAADQAKEQQHIDDAGRDTSTDGSAAAAGRHSQSALTPVTPDPGGAKEVTKQGEDEPTHDPAKLRKLVEAPAIAPTPAATTPAPVTQAAQPYPTTPPDTTPQPYPSTGDPTAGSGALKFSTPAGQQPPVPANVLADPLGSAIKYIGDLGGSVQLPPGATRSSQAQGLPAAGPGGLTAADAGPSAPAPTRPLTADQLQDPALQDIRNTPGPLTSSNLGPVTPAMLTDPRLRDTPQLRQGLGMPQGAIGGYTATQGSGAPVDPRLLDTPRMRQDLGLPQQNVGGFTATAHPDTGAPMQVLPTGQEGSGAPPAPGAAPQASLGSRILGYMNPISSAQAAETPPAAAGSPTVGTDAAQPGPVMDRLRAQQTASAAPAGGALGTQPAVTKQEQSKVEQPIPNSTAVVVPAKVAMVVPNQVSPTVQSEPTPKVTKPAIDPQYYEALTPKYKAMVDEAAADEGVTPQRVAAHWFAENSLKATTKKDGPAGEMGPMQVIPKTWDLMDPKHQLNPRDLRDSLHLGARYMHYLDGQPGLGRDTVASTIAYNGGPGMARRFAADPEGMAKKFPGVVAYSNKIHGPDTKITADQFPGGAGAFDSGDSPETTTTPGSVPPEKIISAAEQGTAAFQNMVFQAARGQPVSDGWRDVQNSLVYAALRRGDYAGVAHARDFVMQQSHQGMFKNLTDGYHAMQNGDSAGAVQALAAAHAFVPDGSIGQFAIAKDGTIWARQMSENDPTKSLGAPQQITQQSILGVLSTTSNPQDFVKFVQEQQKLNADTELAHAHAQYYREGPADRLEASQQHTAELKYKTDKDNSTRLQIAAENAEERRQKEADKAATDKEKVSGELKQRSQQVEKESESAFGVNGSATKADGTPLPADVRARASEIHSDLRMNAGLGEQSNAYAVHLATELAQGKLAVRQTKEGKHAIYDPNDHRNDNKETTAPLGYISPGLASRLFGAQYAPTGAPPAGPAIGGSAALPPSPTYH